MAQLPTPDFELQRTVDIFYETGSNTSLTARRMNLPRTTIQYRLIAANKRGIVPTVLADPKATVVKKSSKEPTTTEVMAAMTDRLKSVESELKFRQQQHLDAEYVKRKILGLTEVHVEPPEWVVRPNKALDGPGVPTLLASDWHWGEVVDPKQIAGVNEYKLSIAQQRARLLIERATDLCFNHIAMPQYPGIVFALGGDMVSGDIHEELTATNEAEIMAVVLDLYGTLVWCITELKRAFGKVFVPCVGGNHGRNTEKIRAKGRNFTSFDWLVYQFLAKHFEGDKDVRFLIPDGPDCYYSVYGYRYLLTHGDQFRGGDGMIGALGPLIRGDHRKRGRNAQIGMEYDTMICGHWHQLIQLQRLIVNGSLVGYNEYAYNSNFPFERPRQALWITHEKQGITFHAPVNVDNTVVRAESPVAWVGWKE